MKIPKLELDFDFADEILVANLKYTLKNLKKDQKKLKKEIKSFGGTAPQYKIEDYNYNKRLKKAIKVVLAYHTVYE